MKKSIVGLGIFLSLCSQNPLFSHCQMPCGIYHDQMVFDQVDQYVETMFKGMTILSDSKFETTRERNEFVRWVIQKEKASDEMAELFTTYFLQQKIKSGEENTAKRLASAHQLMFLMMQIKQSVDRKLVENFADEWEKFKLMFHVEGYECQIEMLKKRNREAAIEKQQAKDATHDEHDHHEH